MVEYIVAIDVTRVRFPADALSLLLFVLCDFVPTRRKEPLSRGYGATVARLTPDQTVGRSNRSGLTRVFPFVGRRLSFHKSIFLHVCDSLAERSKAPDSSSGGAIRVGSNPTAVIFVRHETIGPTARHHRL